MAGTPKASTGGRRRRNSRPRPIVPTPALQRMLDAIRHLGPAQLEAEWACRTFLESRIRAQRAWACAGAEGNPGLKEWG